jgi:hypothetical protein
MIVEYTGADVKIDFQAYFYEKYINNVNRGCLWSNKNMLALSVKSVLNNTLYHNKIRWDYLSANSAIPDDEKEKIIRLFLHKIF